MMSGWVKKCLEYEVEGPKRKTKEDLERGYENLGLSVWTD